MKHNVNAEHLIWKTDMSKLLQIMMANGISLGNRYRWVANMELDPEMERRYNELARKDFKYVD